MIKSNKDFFNESKDIILNNESIKENKYYIQIDNIFFWFGVLVGISIGLIVVIVVVNGGCFL